MKIVIDRIEENFAVAEMKDGNFINLPLEFFNELHIKEGDVITVEKDTEETERRKSEAENLLLSLFEKNEKKSRK